MKYLMITWAPYCRRSESLAHHLRTESVLIHYFAFRVKKYAPLKYALQFLKTLSVLAKKRPRVVIAVAPPIFCPLTAFLFCVVFNRKLVIDAHTGAIISGWSTEVRILHFLARYSAAIVVTNDELAEIVRSWGGNPFVLQDPPITRAIEGNKMGQQGQKILVVNTFSADEPIEEVLKAATMTPTVTYYVTGNKKKGPTEAIRGAPTNVVFTDFIPDDEYWKLLDTCDAVICLTTRGHTLVCGGYEAIYSSKPLITSDFPVLKNYFNFGTVYVNNTASSIAEAVNKVLNEHDVLIEAIQTGKPKMEKQWLSSFNKLEQILSA